MPPTKIRLRQASRLVTLEYEGEASVDLLKRRNVFRVGAAYAVVSWLVLQVSSMPGTQTSGTQSNLYQQPRHNGIDNTHLEDVTAF